MNSNPAAPAVSSEKFRAAQASDAENIAELLKPAAQKGLVLPRAASEIAENSERFQVVELDGEIVGCVALRDFGEGLMEVRSLVVRDDCMGRGLGSRLIQETMQRARGKGGVQLFSLTYRPALFLRQGFFLVDKERFPQKVWFDCSKCPKKESCDEVALLFLL